jgi:hypothetical protein
MEKLPDEKTQRIITVPRRAVNERRDLAEYVNLAQRRKGAEKG